MRPIVILGMHRSGTSAVTRALGLLGAEIGPPANMGEYWENRPMRRINEDILAFFGGAWECPPLLDENWVESAEVQAVLPRARKVLAEEFGTAAVMVWKDPRTCLTLPFWRQVFDEEPVVVFIHRHPIEVARSLVARDGLGRGHSFALWERYNADGLIHSIGLPTTVIEYQTLLEDPIQTMTNLAGSLAQWGVRLTNDATTTEMELSPGRRHHKANVSDLLDDPVATEAQRGLFALLHEVEGVFDRFSLPQPVPAPNPLSVEILGLAAQARASRGDARAARSELSRALGSRHRLLRRLVPQTALQTWRRRLERRDPPGADGASSSGVPKR